jgi:hypothetical protein
MAICPNTQDCPHRLRWHKQKYREQHDDGLKRPEANHKENPRMRYLQILPEYNVFRKCYHPIWGSRSFGAIMEGL